MNVMLAGVLVLALQDKPLKPDETWSGACRSSGSQIDKKELLRITSSEEWQKVWRRHTGDETARPPKVDFERSMVIAVFCGPCGWAQNGHETGLQFKTWEEKDKSLVLTLSLTCTLARYRCQKVNPFWIGVFPKREGSIRIDAAMTSQLTAGEQMTRIGEIK
jgi:hypothetical protein